MIMSVSALKGNHVFQRGINFEEASRSAGCSEVQAEHLARARDQIGPLARYKEQDSAFSSGTTQNDLIARILDYQDAFSARYQGNAKKGRHMREGGIRRFYCTRCKQHGLSEQRASTHACQSYGVAAQSDDGSKVIYNSREIMGEHDFSCLILSQL
jgi:hypothetical protein